MLSISSVDGTTDEVDSTLITIDERAALCWRIGDPSPVARYGLDTIVSIEVHDPAARARREHPNANRRWTPDEEAAVVASFQRGETIKEIATSTGRRVGGIRSRLITLGIIEPRPGDRVAVIASPAAGDSLAGASPAGEVSRASG